MFQKQCAESFQQVLEGEDAHEEMISGYHKMFKTTETYTDDMVCFYRFTRFLSILCRFTRTLSIYLWIYSIFFDFFIGLIGALMVFNKLTNQSMNQVFIFSIFNNYHVLFMIYILRS